MKFVEIKNYLDVLYPPEKSFSWDNDGIEVCSDEESKIKNLLLCLDITPNVADYAISNGVQLIISHHPLLYSPIKKLTYSNPEIKTGLMLFKNNISAISFHTRLDSAKNSVNDMFIKAAKLEYLSESTNNFGNNENDSIGRIVVLAEEKTIAELSLYIKNNLYQTLEENNFNTNFNIKYIDAGIKSKKIAIVAGSGLMFLDDALHNGADTFITGEASYNKLISAAGHKLNFILCNHFESEAVVLPMLKSLIENRFGDVKIEIHTDNIIKEL